MPPVKRRGMEGLALQAQEVLMRHPPGGDQIAEFMILSLS
jgi:hypothetical protein